MTSPRWVNLAVTLAIHDEQLAEHGGLPGVRDMGALESALTRPQNRAAYEDASVPELAAAYAFGIARNHPFVDGNKRTALVVAELFLEINGYGLNADDVAMVVTFLSLAASDLEETALATWFEEHASKQS